MSLYTQSTHVANREILPIIMSTIVTILVGVVVWSIRVVRPRLCAVWLQATKLRGQIVDLKIPEEALWVTSPLTRAIDTFIMACPQPHRLGSPRLVEAGLNASTSQQSRPLKVVVRRWAMFCV